MNDLIKKQPLPKSKLKSTLYMFFDFMSLKSSARLLFEFSQSTFEDEKRKTIIHDMYIKTISYIWLNRIAYCISLIVASAAILWPAIPILLNEFGTEISFFKSDVTQAVITCFAPIPFGIYNHYKKRQLRMENLMRRAIFLNEPNDVIVPYVMAEMEHIDSGLSFNELPARNDSQNKLSSLTPPSTQNKSNKADDSPTAEPISKE
jgi:hypothetical protein